METAPSLHTVKLVTVPASVVLTMSAIPCKWCIGSGTNIIPRSIWSAMDSYQVLNSIFARAVVGSTRNLVIREQITLWGILHRYESLNIQRPEESLISACELTTPGCMLPCWFVLLEVQNIAPQWPFAGSLIDSGMDPGNRIMIVRCPLLVLSYSDETGSKDNEANRPRE